MHESKHRHYKATPAATTLKREEPFPNVLFITPVAFNRTTGGGITFSSLFQGWPQDRLATVHSDLVPITNDVCANYYQLSRKEIRKWGPRKLLHGPNTSTNVSETTTVKSWRRLLIKIVRTLKTWVFGDAIPESVRISPELLRWVGDFRPDVIYTILGSNSIMQLVEELRQRFDLPVAIHIMDDWPATIYRGGLLSWHQRARMQRLLRHLIYIAAARMAICDAMSEAYEVRYGAPFASFQNAIDVDRLARYAKRDLSVANPVRLLYIGSIFPNAQLDSLVDCCEAVKGLQQESMGIKFAIYTPRFMGEQYRSRIVTGSSISLKDTILDDEKFYETIARADILLLPVNFDTMTVRYIRYSMPTKVPAYLLSGTPILVYGPDSVAQVKYAQEQKWGYVVSERNVSRVMDAIRELTSNMALRQQLSAAARGAAAKNHDSGDVRDRFQAMLCSAATSNRMRTIKNKSLA